MQFKKRKKKKRKFCGILFANRLTYCHSVNYKVMDRFFSLPYRSISKSAVDITLEDKTKELMEESRMLLVQFAIDRVSLGVHSMGEVLLL